METLIEQSRRKVLAVSTRFVRSLADKVQWNSRLIGIRGAQGVGKTTLLLQRMAGAAQAGATRPDTRALYVSLDSLWFSRHELPELADRFTKQGGTHLFLDEVHKYPEWIRVLKNIYDDYPDLSIVFTGSSLLTLLDARADLSRRAMMYTMPGLSFREYLNLTTSAAFPCYSLEEIFLNHEQMSATICGMIKPFEHFSSYLKTGYYPYFMEDITRGTNTYQTRLEETLSMILELELPLLRQAPLAYIPKIKRLLSVIAESAPFIPNISRLAERIGINRQTLLTYLHYLEEASLTRGLYKDAQGISALQKPDKLFLENTNLMYLLCGADTDRGNARETFLANQLGFEHRIEFPETGDFLVDGAYVIEVGGKNKTARQLKSAREAAYIAADDIEHGDGNKIPLWLFGFLY